MMLPELPPLSMRPEEEYPDKEIFFPQWQCFCCQDTGKVQPYLVRRVVRNYNYSSDRLPVCQRDNCKANDTWVNLPIENLDTRFTRDICNELDLLARDDWEATRQAWFEMAKQRVEQSTGEIAQAHNLRRRDRIQAEFILAKEKHHSARGDWEEIKDSDEEGQE
ncbi:MAG: hypothetical protein DSM106950_00450 [Stigonema ocellatum SAG 48.90 = DSM 106950]|nr:hypothetical protein [Stigonema ocellatum SAG 48.90 = DSM 106950]